MQTAHGLIIVVTKLHMHACIHDYACIDASKLVSASILFWHAHVPLLKHPPCPSLPMCTHQNMCMHLWMGVHPCKTRWALVHIVVHVWSAQHCTPVYLITNSKIQLWHQSIETLDHSRAQMHCNCFTLVINLYIMQFIQCVTHQLC